MLAGRTGLPLAWLRREAKAGRIPSLRVGRRMLFDFETATAALERRHRETVHAK